MCYFPHHYWQEKDCYQEKQALLGWTSRKCCKNGQNQQIEQSIHHQCLYCKPSEKPQASFKPGSEEKNWIKIIIRKANASSKPSGGLCLCFLKATDLFFHQWTIISRTFYWWGASFGIHLAIAEWVVQLHGDNTIKFHFPLSSNLKTLGSRGGFLFLFAHLKNPKPNKQTHRPVRFKRKNWG